MAVVGMLSIRLAAHADDHSIWPILEPVIRAGETLALARDLSREDALAFWHGRGHEVYVAEEGGRVVGTYFVRANQKAGGSHVANCGYVTAQEHMGRGIAGAMCGHSLSRAKEMGFRAMQFNFVVSSNERAVRLWQSCGLEIVGRLPEAFLHPVLGYVDALVMFRTL